VKTKKKKPLPIGIGDFKELRDKGCAYVDKTLLVQEIIEKSAKVVLISRPRRFGKTLNLSMLRYFFEKSDEDTSYLFKDLNIWKNEKHQALQGQFPVVFISLKDIKNQSLEKTLAAFRKLIAKEYERHRYLLANDLLTLREQQIYHKIVAEDDDILFLEDSLQLLSEWLYRYHNRRVILLVDEYDTPMHSAYIGHYYDRMVEVLRNWVSKSFKDNTYLERGVLTGILRVAKESMFSGANNINAFTVVNDSFSEQFGLLESEVKDLLEEYELPHLLPQVRQWYDGYRIGEHTGIYNPWSVLNCINENGQLLPYWANTGDTALMNHLVMTGSEDLKIDLETLLQKGWIEKNLLEGIIFPNLSQDPNALWSMLLYSGYVTIDSSPIYNAPCRLRIPNSEVETVFKLMIEGWFRASLQERKHRLLLSSLVQGDIHTFSQLFQEFMLSSVSIFDVPAEDSEKIYHAFVLGMLIGLKDRYEVKSNRESGLGRYDVMLIPKEIHDLGIVMEFKKVGRFEELEIEAAVESALQQIEEKQYAQELLDRGISKILYLGFAFKGKQVLIRSKFK